MPKSPVSWLVGSCAMVALLLLLSGPALAVPITIINPSFEDTSGDDHLGGWKSSTGIDTERGIRPSAGFEGNANYTSTYGPNVAFVNLGGDLYQILGTPIAANTTYILKVYVGHPGVPPDPNVYPRPTPLPFAYYVELRFWGELSGGGIDSGDLTQISGSNGVYPLEFSSGYIPEIGKFGPLTLSYTSGTSHVGEYLEILFKANPSSNFVNFDMVTLDAVPVPVPPTLWLLGSGLVGLGLLRRKWGLKA